MKRGICPKCSSSDVYRHNHPQDYRCVIGRGYFTTGSSIHEYICASCGYVESYMSSKKDIEKVVKYAIKV
jgi:predicted nucleic-acid-binding Zn-ribbon protein